MWHAWSKLVFPGPWLDGKSLHELFEAEERDHGGVPTDEHARLIHQRALQERRDFPVPVATAVARSNRPKSARSTTVDEYTRTGFTGALNRRCRYPA
jgi:hypothetical protein